MMTVIKRLLVLVATALAGMLGIGAFGLLAMEKVRDSASYAAVNSVPSYEVLDDSFQNFVDTVNDVALHVLSSDPAGKAALDEKLAARWPQLLSTLARYEPLLSDEHDRELLAGDRAALADYEAQRQAILAASNAARREEAHRLLQASLATVDRVADAFQAHRKYNHALAAAGSEAAQGIYGQATWVVVGSTLFAIVFSSIAALLIIRKLLKQLGGEPEYAVGIAGRIAAGDLAVAIATRADDRTSLLAVMKDMRDSLRAAQTELAATARQAGMAEIAANVLHNVGNVLNSVNVSASLIGTQLRTSKLKGVARAAQLLAEHADDPGPFLTEDARGKLLPGYLRELAQTLAGEQAAMADELAVLGKNLEHIKAVVAAQQSYAGTPRFVEAMCLGELVDDALRINAGALSRDQIRVVKAIGAFPALPLDRNRLLLILVNLISNARHALTGSDRPCLTISAALEDGCMLRLSVADNGAGIAPENLSRIFSHGFTTRRDGHGFGLHSCALAAREMDGSLTVHSEGSGQGASFTLEIPIDASEGTQ